MQHYWYIHIKHINIRGSLLILPMNVVIAYLWPDSEYASQVNAITNQVMHNTKTPMQKYMQKYLHVTYLYASKCLHLSVNCILKVFFTANLFCNETLLFHSWKRSVSLTNTFVFCLQCLLSAWKPILLAWCFTEQGEKSENEGISHDAILQTATRGGRRQAHDSQTEKGSVTSL